MRGSDTSCVVSALPFKPSPTALLFVFGLGFCLIKLFDVFVRIFGEILYAILAAKLDFPNGEPTGRAGDAT